MNWPKLIFGLSLVIAGVIAADIGTSFRESLGMVLLIVGSGFVHYSQKRDNTK